MKYVYSLTLVAFTGDSAYIVHTGLTLITHFFTRSRNFFPSLTAEDIDMHIDKLGQ